MIHPKVLADPALRQRYGIKGVPKSRNWLLGVLIGIVAAWFAWSGYNAANPAVRSELVSFKIIDAQSISITYKITVRDISTDHNCAVVARDIDKNVVGEVTDSMPADALMVGANLRTLTIPTRLPAVNAGISSCQ